MKKGWIILIIGIILIIAVGAYVYFSPQPEQRKLLTTEEILLIMIKPEIDAYCNNLNTKAINSNCPTCLYYNLEDKDSSYLFVNNFDEGAYDLHRYTIEETDEGFIVNMKMHLIYGRNDRPGEVILTFNIDKDKGIINKNMPEMNCL